MWSKIKKWAIKQWWGDGVDLGVKYSLFDKISMVFGGCLFIIGVIEMFIKLGSVENYGSWAAFSLVGAILVICVRAINTEKRLKEILKNKNVKAD